MIVKVNVTDDQGTVLAIIHGATNGEPGCPEYCDHDGHFNIDSVRSGIGFARDALADEIIRSIPVVPLD
jgi:hypothetical protein